MLGDRRSTHFLLFPGRKADDQFARAWPDRLVDAELRNSSLVGSDADIGTDPGARDRDPVTRHRQRSAAALAD